MKKINALLLALLLCGTSAFSQMAPWFYGDIPNDWKTVPYTRASNGAASDTIVAYDVTNSFFDASTDGIDDIWDYITASPKAVSRIIGTGAESAEDFSATIKMGFDETNLYILYKCVDNSYATNGTGNAGTDTLKDKWEVMIASYADSMIRDSVSDWESNENWDDKVLTAYWNNYGGYKFKAEKNGAIAIDDATNALNWVWGWDAPNTIGLETYVEDVDATNFNFMIVFPFAAFKGMITYADAVAGTKLGSFDCKYVDTDEGVADEKITAFNTENNSIYGSMYFAATLAFSQITTSLGDVKANNRTVYIESNNLKITGGNAKNIAVYDMTGRMITKKSNSDYISIAGLKSGVYVVKADNVTLKFKK